ncbi:MAG: SEC-C domain-containing protein [Planctomycetes bacterium]|nr:SEC-C domain-containing protein [Planctomycetota bacterium]
MVAPFVRDTIEGWVADFEHGDGVRAFSARTRELAGLVLARFHVAACDARGSAPGELDEADVQAALERDVAKLELEPNVKSELPALVAAYLAELERQGRLADGARLGAFVRASRARFDAAAGGKVQPYERPGAAVGRNDPCPCGSGKKYKKCCQNLLG